MKNNAKTALKWIVAILRKHDIPFQVTGGLAAIAYGASRELADIDIDIPEEAFEIIQPAVAAHITFGPAQFKSEQWNLYLMTLNYQGQDIDLSGAYKTKIFNKQKNRWQKIPANFSTTENIKIMEIVVPIIARSELLKYKTMLARQVDLIDIKQIQENKNNKKQNL